ncbi:hypothetical protein QEN41_16340 [Gordonia alkanivorans]|uniref:hypothetical protein n=1 Tax=Gordonia alkanivorans TaxID=84096 RepID=UPI002448A6F8|nr:hypothetical protein [Gordonia alkanivorans]MDH3021552.1 hypothetical protein [Gordonia alkanivorans]MDJ0027471.1 hypothetical protein [Gordonia alkanivorans]
MTASTRPDVHLVYTDVQTPSDFGRNRHTALGFVDNAGVYHFPDGSRVLTNGDHVEPSGATLGSSVIVGADGSKLSGGPLRDAAFPEDNADRSKHHVDALYQSTYDANPDAYDAHPAKVFTDADARP